MTVTVVITKRQVVESSETADEMLCRRFLQDYGIKITGDKDPHLTFELRDDDEAFRVTYTD